MGKELDFLIRARRPLAGFGSGEHFVRALDMRQDEPIGFPRVSGAKLCNDHIGTDECTASRTSQCTPRVYPMRGRKPKKIREVE
jgi:hypothetical protein